VIVREGQTTRRVAEIESLCVHVAQACCCRRSDCASGMSPGPCRRAFAAGDAPYA